MIIATERAHFRSIILLFSNGITLIPKQILGALSPIPQWNSLATFLNLQRMINSTKVPCQFLSMEW